MRIALVLISTLALAACGAGDSGDTPSEPIADSSMAAGAKEEIDLNADGLTVPPQDGDDALEVPFGSMRAATEATLGQVLGEAISRQENDECPAGPMEMTRYQGLTLNFQEGRFVGWIAEDPYLPTESRALMLDAGAITMLPDSSLGDEFVIGNPDGAVISGMFGEGGDDARISHLWAGSNCIFR